MNFTKLLALLLLCAPFAYGNTCLSQGTGNWNVAGTWTTCGGGVPGNGDTVTIASPNVVTVSDTETVGTSGASGTLALTINNGATLTISSTGILNLRGELDLQKGGTYNQAGELNFNPPNGATYKFLITASGSGNASVNISGSVGNEAIVTTTQQTSGGGNGWFDFNTNAAPILTFSYANVQNCGSASVFCTWGEISSAGQNITVTNSQFIAVGQVDLGTTNGTITFLMDHTDFRNCPDTVNNACFRFASNVANSSGSRKITNTTIYNTGNMKSALIFAPNVVIGQSIASGDASNVPGIYAYNGNVALNVSNAQNSTVKSGFMVSDSGAIEPFDSFGASGNIFEDSVVYVHSSNPHFYVESGNNAGTGNLYKRIICDGDGFWSADAGDFALPSAAATILNNINIHSCGTAFTALNVGAAITMNNTTEYSSYGGSIGETAGAAGQIVSYSNNLIVLPSQQQGANAQDEDGLHQQAAFVRQSGMTVDYNGFFGMPGSGDAGAGAGSTPAMISHPTLGVVSYVFFPVATVVASTTATASTDTTHVFCSTCNFTGAGVIAGDYVLNTTRSSAYAIITTVNSATEVTLATAIAGQVSGDSFQIRTSYWSTAGFKYGDSGRGSHDLHASPQFIAPTRTLVAWDIANGGPGTIADVAAQIVKLNGYDSSGTATTWNPAYDVQQAISYINLGFTSMQGQYKNASNGTDTGALPVYPATAQVIM